MADPEHLAILEQGRETWNAWRLANPDIEPDLTMADLPRMDLRQFDLHDAILDGIDCSGSRLDGASLSGARVSGSWFVEATLVDGDLRGADFYSATFRDADLTRANLSDAELVDTNFVLARLQEAKFVEARLWGAILRNPEMEGVDLSGAELMNTVFIDWDMSVVKGLNTCEHRGPSVLDHRTLASSGHMPDVFLRGCGLPERLIEYLPSILDQPILLYSCFISFTESDDAFAKRIYNDLQGNGVRCWRWKEDARGGRSLIGEVDGAVRLHDKLIVICSESSLRSGPVIREIERALQREDRLVAKGETPEVLFPIRLDDSIFDWEHPRQADVVEKVVSDFRNWRDHDSYQASFAKLLRDLRLDT